MLRLEYLNIEDLDDNPENWRCHPNGQLTALSDVIDQVGWAGALLYNERTKRLIDGHARKKVATGKVPVLIGSWSEEQERLILATLDPLAALATTDGEKLGDLIAGLDPQSDAIAELFNGLTDDAGVFDVAGIEMPDLSTAEKTHEQMTFTVSTEQAQTIRTALAAAKAMGPFVDTGNENQNGNALARACEVFLGTS